MEISEVQSTSDIATIGTSLYAKDHNAYMLYIQNARWQPNQKLLLCLT